MQVRYWWLAARPKTLSISVVPVVVGIALAWHSEERFRPLIAAATLLAALLIQIGTNLYNDAADFERGADRDDRLGPDRAAARGWLSPAALKRGAHRAFASAFLLGVPLAWAGGWPIVALGLLSVAAGYAYTGGRHPIAYSASGELFAFLFFGPAAVAGSAYLQTGTVSDGTLATGAAIGLFAAAVLLVNNYRDLDSDRRAGKLTLVHFLGRRGARRLYAALVLLPFLLPPVLGRQGLLVWLALPLALLLIRDVFRLPPGREFNGVLARTARLEALFGVLLTLALLLP